jgi:hypothetical protein
VKCKAMLSFFRPVGFPSFTHSLRCGLHSVAASRLVVCRVQFLSSRRKLGSDTSVGCDYLLVGNLGYTPLPPVFWYLGVRAGLPPRSLSLKDLYAKYSAQRIYGCSCCQEAMGSSI